LYKQAREKLKWELLGLGNSSIQSRRRGIESGSEDSGFESSDDDADDAVGDSNDDDDDDQHVDSRRPTTTYGKNGVYEVSCYQVATWAESFAEISKIMFNAKKCIQLEHSYIKGSLAEGQFRVQRVDK
jgi:hypothetical protein